MGLQAFVQRPFAGMTERGVTEVMGQRQRLGEVLVKPELPGQRAGDLGHFQRVGQPGAVMIAFVEHENLGFMLQAAEGGGMDNPIAIAPERAAGLARRFRKQPAAAAIGVAGIKSPRGSHSDRHGFLLLIHLILRDYVLNYVGRVIPNELGMTPATGEPSSPLPSPSATGPPAASEKSSRPRVTARCC